MPVFLLLACLQKGERECVEECLIYSAVNRKIGGLSCGFYIFVYNIIFIV